MCIWRLLDGKPGHESQTLGLARAMQRLAGERGQPMEIVDLPVAKQRLSLWDFLLKRFSAAENFPPPDFIIGAGHRTHWPMLCARRAFGGKAIALMSPSLPLPWFDLVVIPEHDNRSGRNVIVTRGVLNAMQPGVKQPGRALVLVGGESKHFAWNDAAVLVQISAIMSRSSGIQITDSRRTPSALRRQLQACWPDAYQSWEECHAGWLVNELAAAENVWVTEDSVSMIYESLTAGCKVGLISLPRSNNSHSRLVQGIAALIDASYVFRLNDAVSSSAHNKVVPPLREAERIASYLLMQNQ